jgi:hypothetical protein
MSSEFIKRRPGGCRMEQLDLLRYLARVIEEMGLRYFVTGSTATMFYGEQRTSQ